MWLLLYLIMVAVKAGAWAMSGGKSDSPILVWNHPKAVEGLLAPDEVESLIYCGRGGWKHRMYSGYLSQIVYVYLTHRRVLVVSKNHGNHEFLLSDLQLETDGSGKLHLHSPAHAVYLGFVSDEGIQAVTSAVNSSRGAAA